MTRHCRERLEQRGISADYLEYAMAHTVGNPQPGEIGSIWVYGRTPGGRILKVCVATNDHQRIITAVWPDT